ncbi:hypothetical protein CRYUN_Cryun33cG0055100 [Craigia yunnanensis]
MICLQNFFRAQVVGWPPIRSFRKNTMASNPPKTDDDAEAKLGSGCLFVKVSMDGAPYLRKVDLKIYGSYKELSSALEKMFSCFTIGQCGSHGVPSRDGLSESRLIDLLHGSEYVLTYEDKDGDWMLVGDVPWEMFTDSCKRLRIMKSSEAIGLGLESDLLVDFLLVSTASDCISEPSLETSVTGKSDSSTATSVPVADLWIPSFLCKAYPVLYCGNDVTQVDRGNSRNECNVANRTWNHRSHVDLNGKS